MFVATGFLPTIHASAYIARLCRHFAHKVPVEWDTESGRAELPPGPAAMQATAEGLLLRVEAEDAKGVILARYIVDSHLATFAFREGFTGFDWHTEKT